MTCPALDVVLSRSARCEFRQVLSSVHEMQQPNLPMVNPKTTEQQLSGWAPPAASTRSLRGVVPYTTPQRNATQSSSAVLVS